MSSAPPPRALSKGTLGLKFMNKVKPMALIAEPVAPTPAPAPAARAETKKSGKAKVVIKQEEDVQMEGIEQTTVSSSRPQVIHEGSLLSFPLLSSATSSRSFAAPTSYTSMPWTASVVSGRRSFGGANAEIEQLNNPSIQTPTPSTNPDAESNSSKKKRKKSERDEIPLNVRQPPTSTTTSSFQANADEIKLGGGSSFNKNSKKARVDVPSPFAKGGFAKPKGFEDVKKGGGSSRGALPSKTSRKEGKTGKWKEEEHVWGAQGTERAWDVGKESEEYESDDSGSESESEEDFEELMITKNQRSTKVLDKEGERVKRAKFDEAVDELLREGGGEKEVEEALGMAERKFDEGEEESTVPRAKGKKGKKGKKASN